MSDINNQGYNAEYVEYDPAAEQRQSTFTPISDGTRLYKLSAGQKGVEIKTSQKGNMYVQAHAVGEVVAPGTPENGKKVSFWLNEFGRNDSQGRKQPSDLHLILLAAGIPLQSKMGRAEFADAVRQALGVEPSLKIYTRWQIQVKTMVDGKEKRITAVKGMKSFPQNADGSFNPVYSFTPQQIQDYGLADGATQEAELGVFLETPAGAAGGAAGQ